MGILDLLGGLGKAGAAPWTQRLSSGLGQQGGMLQHLGLGKYANQKPDMGAQMGQGGSMIDFLHNLGGQMGGPQASDMGVQQQPQPQQGSQHPLGDLIRQWMQQNQQGQ